MGSIGGGGRYDDLTGIFGLKSMSGVGISFGLDRIALVMEEEGNMEEYKKLMEEAVSKNSDAAFLTYGEYFIQGKSEEEVLISTHICHPSLANDNLSGISVATYLALHLQKSQPYYSYRFVFIPATIGAITWLALD